MTRFTNPSFTEKTLQYVRASIEAGDLGGDGPFTQRCHALLQKAMGAPTLLTNSGTAALDMCAILAQVRQGDEVIMPSYTFVSTANAFVLRGATPVFVDIRPDTLNLNERLLDQAFSERTRAVVPVHYAGVACEMAEILDWAKRHSLIVIEDAAQGVGASYNGRPLGGLGDLGCLSFHVTKNIVSGEGGALVINNESYAERAHIIREKGTNRTAFFERKVDKYEWLDLGSSFLPSDVLAAMLLSQLEVSDAIMARRLHVWNRYHAAFEAAEQTGKLRRPVVPQGCGHNGHIYYILLPDRRSREIVSARLLAREIYGLTHYVPLHSAPAGKLFGRAATDMKVTNRVAQTLLRLPIHGEMSSDETDQIADAVNHALREL